MTDSQSIHHCPLAHLGAIAVCGEDAATFFQGQTTCDVRGVTPQRSSQGALCTPKGRVIATFRLMHTGEGFLLTPSMGFALHAGLHLSKSAPGGFVLLLSRDLLESVLKRLRLYILRAKVSLVDASDDWHIAGLAGSGLDSLLQQADLVLPGNVDGAYLGESSLVVRVPGEPPRCLLLLRSEATVTWLESLDAMDEKAWSLADIANGLPQIGAKLSEEFIPQMLNLDLIGAVSLQKGCYTGQEIVARTHYLGQSKRRTYRYKVVGTACPGDSLYAVTQTEAVGTVVNVAGNQLLAVVTCEYSAEPLRLGNPQGPVLQPLPLPYEI